MSVFEIFWIAICLSIDAFAVATTKGLASKKWKWKNGIIIGLYFGIFQALMPLLGYYLGISLKSYIEDYDHFIACGLLALIGGKMIYGSFKNQENEKSDASIAFKVMFILAIATSIDALSVGIGVLTLENVNIILAISLIGITTFVLSVFGVFIGTIVGNKFKSKAELFGGVILILIGIKILLSHLGVINF